MRIRDEWWLIGGCQTWEQAGGGEGVQNGWRSQKIPTIKYINDGDMMYSMVTIVNNTVFYIWKFLRVNFQSPYHKKEKVSNHVWWQVLMRWSCWLLHNVYKYQIISCTPQPDTMVLIAVNYTSVKNVSDINWWHGSVIPVNHRQLPGKQNRWLLGVGGSVVCKAEAQRTQEPRWGWKRTRRARWPRTTVKTVTADRRDEPLCPLLLNLESNEQREVTIRSGGREMVADFGKSVSMGGKDKHLVTVSGWDTRTLRKRTWALKGSCDLGWQPKEKAGPGRAFLKGCELWQDKWVPYLWTFKLGTFKDVNVCLHVQSRVWHTLSPVCIL